MESSKLLNLLKNSASEAELKGFWEDLGNTLLGQVIDFGNGILAPLTLTAAQLLAQVGLGGGISPIGKRDFWNELGDNLLGQLTTAANGLLAPLALTAAQLLAQFGLSGGINPIGKRTPEELKGFFDSFTSALTDVFNTVLLPAVNNQLTNVALLGAHVLGGLSQENDIIGTLGTLVGKRSQDELRGFLDSFTSTLTDIFNTVLLPAVNNQLTNVALLGAHVLGGLSQENDIIGTLGTLVGKRETLPFSEFMSQLGASMVSQITPALQSALANMSLTSAQWLANFSQNGGLLG